MLPMSICSIGRLSFLELEVSYSCWSKEKLNHLLKTDGVILFTDFLTDKMLYNDPVMIP